MPHAERTITVNRPARAVFDYLADGTHNAEWRTGVVEIERTSAGGGQGATYRQVLAGPGGRRIDGDYKVTVFDPPTRLEFQVTAGPARPAGVFELAETTPGATRASRFVCPYGLFPWLTSRHQPTQLSVFSPNTSPHPSSHSYTKCSTPSSSNFPRNGQHSIPIGPRGRASGLLEIAVSAMLRPADPSIQLATLGPEHCRYSPNDLY